MTQIGLEFEIIPSAIEEIMDISLKPYEVAVSLASQKCLDVAAQIKNDSIVIGADTIVVKNNKLLGKPKDAQEAFEMLKYLNGDWHEVITGVCLHRTGIKKTISGYEITKVKIANNSDEFLKSYISTKEPFDKAGAYGIQGYGSLIVERIEGCFFNVMGLPVFKLSCLLKELGYTIGLEDLSTKKTAG